MDDEITNHRNRKPVVLNGGSLVPVGAVITGVAILFSAYIWLTNQLNDIKFEIRMWRLQTTEFMTRSEMQMWAARLRASNITLQVPDPAEIFRARDDAK